MPGSSTWVFREPEDFEAALGAGGCLDLWITGRGKFRAQLAQVTLHRLRLWTAEEQLSRVAFIAVPADMVMMSFPIGTGTGPIYGGIGVRGAGEIMTLGPGQHTHARTNGPCHWAAIWLPVKELVHYGSALTGAPFAIPSLIQCWRPAHAAGQDLHNLHAAAARMAAIRPQARVDAEAAHGLEQQLIHAVVECLSRRFGSESSAAIRRHQDVMTGFQRLLQTWPDRNVRITEICATLGVSDRLLRSMCAEHLGMGANRYLRLRRMSLVHRALRHGHDAARVSDVARRYGFGDPGRFAVEYRVQFGELPSATLRRALAGDSAFLAAREVNDAMGIRTFTEPDN